MKIAMLAAEYPPKWGGIGVHAFNLSNALANDGHEVHVITRKEKDKPPAQPKGVKIHTVDWLKVPLWFILSYGKNALKKVEELSNEKFDVLHQHSPLIALKREWYDKINLPLVSTMHGTWYMERKSLEKEPLSALGVNDLAIRFFSRKFEKYEKLAIERSNKVITISNHCVMELEKFYSARREIELVPNGVDTTMFVPPTEEERHILRKKIIEKYKLPENAKMILYVGRFAGRKGIIYLVQSLAMLRKRYPNAFLIMMGKYGRYISKLEAEGNHLGVRNAMLFSIGLPMKELLEHYKACDVFALPSTYEGQGIVLLEAMSSGLPCVATNVGGIPDMFDGKNGLLVPLGDVQALSESIEKLITDEDYWYKVSKASRDTAVCKYDWSIIAKRVLDVYKKAIM